MPLRYYPTITASLLSQNSITIWCRWSDSNISLRSSRPLPRQRKRLSDTRFLDFRQYFLRITQKQGPFSAMLSESSDYRFVGAQNVFRIILLELLLEVMLFWILPLH